MYHVIYYAKYLKIDYLKTNGVHIVQIWNIPWVYRLALYTHAYLTLCILRLQGKIVDILIDPKRLQLNQEIGQGQFGKVYQGIFDVGGPDQQDVAVKTAKGKSMNCFTALSKPVYQDHTVILESVSSLQANTIHILLLSSHCWKPGWPA